jgi:hypothetical protein
VCRARYAVLDGKVIVMCRLAITGMAAKLAEYVAAADKQGLKGDPFRNGVGQMFALAKKEATAGPAALMARWQSGCLNKTSRSPEKLAQRTTSPLWPQQLTIARPASVARTFGSL